jgi:hypothetical protein
MAGSDTKKSCRSRIFFNDNFAKKIFRILAMLNDGDNDRQSARVSGRRVKSPSRPYRPTKCGYNAAAFSRRDKPISRTIFQFHLELCAGQSFYNRTFNR